MTGKVHEGGCLCGAVRYRIEGTPIDAGYCHCRQCRQSLGAPVAIYASFPAGALAWTRGEPTWYRATDRAERGHCAVCGTALAFRFLRTPTEIDVTVPSLDDPEAIAPGYHIFTAERLGWFDTADDLPRHEGRGPDRGPAA